MNTEVARIQLIDLIETVAPGVDAAAVDPSRRLRDELDIDSLDFLRIVQVIHDRIGVDIPETDYEAVSSLNDLVEYVAARVPA